MHRCLLTLLILGVPSLYAAGPPRCPDNGESSSKRVITPTFGTKAKLADVPKSLKATALDDWSSAYVPRDEEVPDGLMVVAARQFRLGGKTFYALTIRDEQSIFSTACERNWCTDGRWWPADATVVADTARPPRLAASDEWYLLTTDGPLLAARDQFTEGLPWEEECRMSALTDAKTKGAVRPPKE